MKDSIFKGAGFLMLLVIFAATARADGLKEGKWSMTMVTKMEGMSAETSEAMKEMENMPPEAMAMMKQMQGKMGVQMSAGAEGITTTVTQCVTAKDPVPNAESPENCTQTHQINGSTVSFHVTCKTKHLQSDSTGKVTYAGDSMQGQIKSHQLNDGHSTDATIQITGKYLGPC